MPLAARLPCAGLVEAVLNGSTLRLTLLPERTPVTVTLAGVQCPSMGKRPPPPAAAAPAPEANGSAPEANGNGTANGNGAAPAAVTAASIAASGVSASAPGGAELGSREAKWFTESRVLNREVSHLDALCLLVLKVQQMAHAVLSFVAGSLAAGTCRERRCQVHCATCMLCWLFRLGGLC